MFRKRSTIVLLIGVNLFLLVALLSQIVSLPTAFAQRGGRGGSYVSVTAKGARQTYDILYVVDASDSKLYGLYPNRVTGGRLITTAPRNLKADFQQN